MKTVKQILEKLVRRLLVNGSNHSDNLIGQAEAELLSIDNEEIERLSNEAKLWKTEWEQITETARQMQVRIKVLEEELLKCINWIEKVTKALEPLPSDLKEEI